MGFKNLAKGVVKNLGDAHTVEGIGGAYLRRAAAGAGIGAVAGGTVEAIQGGSFGEGAVSGAVKGGIIGAGTVAYKAAGLGSDVFEKGTQRLAKVRDKGTVFRDMWNGVDVSKSQMNKATNYLNVTKSRATQGEQLTLFNMGKESSPSAPKNTVKNNAANQSKLNAGTTTSGTAQQLSLFDTASSSPKKTYSKPTAEALTGQTKKSTQNLMHGIKTGKYHWEGNKIVDKKGRIIV